MPIQPHPLEILPPILYLIALLYLGFRSPTRSLEEEDFLLDGRRLTLPGFVATLVTTWYGGILGVGEFTYLYGLSNWVVFGFPYYIFALLFAFLLAPRIRQSDLMTIPDQFFHHYGRAEGFLATFYTFLLTQPAAYILMIGLLLNMFTGWPLWLCIVLGMLFSIIYVVNGGFRAVVRTDMLQFVLMYVGFFVMLMMLIHRFGGWSFLQSRLPASHLSLFGGHSWQYILVWYFIAAMTFIDPGFHQRCYAACTPMVARKGILISVGFWFLFDFLTTSTGLYARALLSDIRPTLSFPLLGHQFLPPLLAGLFLTGLMATIMSTVDSLTLLSALTIGHDFLKKITPDKMLPTQLTRWGLLATALISIAIAILVPSVIQIWYLLGTLLLPPLLLPLLACYFPIMNPGRGIVRLNLILAFLVSAMFLALSIARSPSLMNLQYFGGIQPMYPGLFTSLLLFFIGWAKKRLTN